MEILFFQRPVIKMYANAYKRCSLMDGTIARNLLCAAVLSVLAAGIPVSAQAQKGETPVSCTNPYSGATWQIRIDYDRSTVDANPARINDATISWRDAKDGWSYTLDRKSGKLTITLASSTGGSFLHDQCKLDN
jgi:hypothetical protein